MKFDEGDPGCAGDGHEQVEPSFGRADFNQIYLEVAERVGHEAQPLGLAALDLRRSTAAVVL
ncbi:hypothetical protein [Methylobacterium sp. E-016]|uniref:hypothetical protein n=1 Tax=Methylobacterium sp. E-016 TaxID=2836556 RepID=UPI00391A2563